jgi:hypothetical protein
MHRPFRNYPDVTHRGPAPGQRRRQWSQWSIMVNPNITTTGEMEQELVAELLTETAQTIFSRPGLIALFMESTDVGPGATPANRPRGYPMAVYRDFRGDRFDGTHVFQHSFRTNTEVGSRFSRTHIMIKYAVLHNSAFKINTRTRDNVIDENGRYISFPFLFSKIFNDILENKDNPYLDINGWREDWVREIDVGHPGVRVWVDAKRLFEEEEYDTKKDASQAGNWTNLSRGMQPAADPITGALLPAQPDGLWRYPPPPVRSGAQTLPSRDPQTEQQRQLAARRAAVQAARERQ